MVLIERYKHSFCFHEHQSVPIKASSAPATWWLLTQRRQTMRPDVSQLWKFHLFLSENGAFEQLTQCIHWHQSCPLMVDPVYKVSCPGETEAETAGWLGSPGPGRGAFPVCVCVCVRPAPNSSLIIHIVSDAGLRAQRRIWSRSHWPRKQSVFPVHLSDRQTWTLSSPQEQAARGRTRPSPLCLSTYGGPIPSLLCSHDAFLHCHSWGLFAQMYIYLVPVSAEADLPASWPLGSQ